MKAQELSGEHVGKRISVDTKDLVVAGKLVKVVHRYGIDQVDLSFIGGVSLLHVKRDAEVEVLDE